MRHMSIDLQNVLVAMRAHQQATHETQLSERDGGHTGTRSKADAAFPSVLAELVTHICCGCRRKQSIHPLCGFGVLGPRCFGNLSTSMFIKSRRHNLCGRCIQACVFLCLHSNLCLPLNSCCGHAGHTRHRSVLAYALDVRRATRLERCMFRRMVWIFAAIARLAGWAIGTDASVLAAIATIVCTVSMVLRLVAACVARIRALIGFELWLVTRGLRATITLATAAIATITGLKVCASAPIATVPIIASSLVACRRTSMTQ